MSVVCEDSTGADIKMPESVLHNGDTEDMCAFQDDKKHLLCPVCNELYCEPRVLPCLHVCCTSCIERLVASLSAEQLGSGVIECPVCQQRAALPDGGNVSCLPLDVVSINSRDVVDLRQQEVACTSCHAHQIAIARCVDCVSFLCAICVNAHTNMHCFKNHKLVSFDEMANGSSPAMDFHKPMFCSLHQSENLEYFCYSCQIPLCKSCTSCRVHRTHRCEPIADIETAQFAELRSLVNDVTAAKISCEATLENLQTALGSLRSQRDIARVLIEQTMSAHLKALEKRKDDILSELHKMHTDNKQSSTDNIECMHTTLKHMREACRFADRILQHGRGYEVASSKSLVVQRLLMLNLMLSQLSKRAAEIVPIEFETEEEKFTAAVQATFGHLSKSGDNEVEAVRDHVSEDAVSHPLFGPSAATDRHLHGSVVSPDSNAPSHVGIVGDSIHGRKALIDAPMQLGSVTFGGGETARSNSWTLGGPLVSGAAISAPARSSSVIHDEHSTNNFWIPEETLHGRSLLGNIGGRQAPPAVDENHVSSQFWTHDNVSTTWKPNNDFLTSLSSVGGDQQPPRPILPFDVPDFSQDSAHVVQPPQTVNFFDHTMSHNSSSPNSLSDSGISIDAASNSSGVRGVSAPEPSLLTASMLARMMSQSPNSYGIPTGAGGRLASGLETDNASILPSLLPSAVNHQQPPSSVSDTVLSSLISSLSLNSNSPSALTDVSQLLATLTGTANRSPIPTTPGGSAASTESLTELLSELLAPYVAPGIMKPLAPMQGLQAGSLPCDMSDIQARTSINRSSKMSQMHMRCRIGEPGVSLGQLSSPHGFCLGIDEDIVVADTLNHRIQIFSRDGETKNIFGSAGRDDGQLWHPRKVAFSRQSMHYIVCDRGNERSRLQVFTQFGHFIRKISIRYIDIVAGLTVDVQGHIIAVDSVKPTVFCITERGELIRWFDCCNYMCEPSDIAVIGHEYFVCDFKGHCVAVFTEDGQFVRRIGDQSLTTFPSGIDTSDAGDILVGDSHGNRFHIAVFERDGTLVSEFECPYIKVSRCCGLRVTSDGHVITLSKNNQHVIVFNTLYIA